MIHISIQLLSFVYLYAKKTALSLLLFTVARIEPFPMIWDADQSVVGLPKPFEISPQPCCCFFWDFLTSLLLLYSGKSLWRLLRCQLGGLPSRAVLVGRPGKQIDGKIDQDGWCCRRNRLSARLRGTAGSGFSCVGSGWEQFHNHCVSQVDLYL